ncbi:unnamed protein product [Durusdinium trenchii]|uniref:Uncharacterized protein n=1 Tax=Durusdinium trenchii TaxID=1381693 RepID=A0ABP0S9R6_9DINO
MARPLGGDEIDRTVGPTFFSFAPYSRALVARLGDTSLLKPFSALCSETRSPGEDLGHSWLSPELWTAEDGATPTDFLGAAAEQLATVMESFESMMAQGIDLIREEEKPAPSKAA